MSSKGAEGLAALYLCRPSPEYSRAFDLVAGMLEATDGPALVVASSPVHAVEFLKRCRRPLDFAAVGAFDAGQFVAEAAAWAGGPIHAVTLGADGKRYAACAWAEPERSTAAAVAAAVRSSAQSGARLDVVATSVLRCYLPAWQAQPGPAVGPLAPGAAAARLQTAGWRIASCLVYHGPRSILWSQLQRLADAAGRPDWANRCRLAMWASYQEKAWFWPLAPLALIRAQRR